MSTSLGSGRSPACSTRCWTYPSAGRHARYSIARRGRKLAGIEIESSAGASRLDVEGLFPLYAMTQALDAAPTMWSTATYGVSS
jgi:hypothetical protein